MARYIDADKLMERLNKKKPGAANQRYTEGFNDALMRFRSMLHSEPAADVVRVEEARWKGAGMGDYYCSLCQETVSGNKFKYCPYCGAKMNGGESDE